MGLHQTKKLAVKETINEMKRQTTKREKTFENYTSDKGLLSKIYKELIKVLLRSTTKVELFPKHETKIYIPFFQISYFLS